MSDTMSLDNCRDAIVHNTKHLGLHFAQMSFGWQRRKERERDITSTPRAYSSHLGADQMPVQYSLVDSPHA
jgi:hypothetical protein